MFLAEYLAHCSAWKWSVQVLGREIATQLALRPQSRVPSRFICYPGTPPPRGVG
jgi:hypothetical protein